MDRYFRTVEDELVNVIDHTLEQIEKWPNLKIYVATDSQDKDGKTIFATVVCYRYGTRGAHFIYLKEKLPRYKVMYNRLFDEAVRTFECADMISSEIPIKIEALEFDYNHIPNFKSNQLLNTVKGWALGLNYNPVFKSGWMIAAKAADHVCRK
jgi:predicted RNase H-related nuclease YkuK (DUF458 family)